VKTIKLFVLCLAVAGMVSVAMPGKAEAFVTTVNKVVVDPMANKSYAFFAAHPDKPRFLDPKLQSEQLALLLTAASTGQRVEVALYSNAVNPGAFTIRLVGLVR